MTSGILAFRVYYLAKAFPAPRGSFVRKSQTSQTLLVGSVQTIAATKAITGKGEGEERRDPSSRETR